MTVVYEKPKRHVHSVFVHCTAHDTDFTIDTIAKWHKKLGWKTVGYHYLIRRDGEVQIGRSVAQQPAAQKGHNKGTIAIALTGHHWFTIEQIHALQDLCMTIDGAHIPGRLRFRGHNEVANKACPVINLREVLRLNDLGKIRRA